MFFKNIVPMTLNMEYLEPSQFEVDLARRPLVKPLPTERVTFGWVNTIGQLKVWQTTDGMRLITLGKKERLLPAQVVNEELAERVKLIASGNDNQPARKVGSIERKEIKEDIEIEFLPQAFIKTTYTRAWIDLSSNAIFIEASSTNKAEEFCDELRKTIGSLPVTPVEFSPTLLTSMLMDIERGYNEGLFKEFKTTYNCKLEGGEKDTAVYKNIDLESLSVIDGINEEGRYVSELGLNWGEDLEFTLTTDCVLKGVSFLDVINQELANNEYETKSDEIDATYSIMVNTVRILFSDLKSVLS